MIECPICKKVLVNSTYEEWAKAMGYKTAKRVNLSHFTDTGIRRISIECECGITNLFTMEGQIDPEKLEKNAEQRKN